jgi:hypothetical protein
VSSEGWNCIALIETACERGFFSAAGLEQLAAIRAKQSTAVNAMIVMEEGFII